MKRARKAPWFVAGMLCATMLATTVGPALAAVMVPQTLEVHTGVEVYVDDKRIDAGETHGNPDAFIYNGTTYVAVAAVSKSLGEKVIWDGENKRVYIGDHDGASQYLLDVCPPYNADTGNITFHSAVVMSGTTYNSALSTYDSAYFNLNGMYDTLTFTVGHMDKEGDDLDRYEDATYSIYLDGKLARVVLLEGLSMPQNIEVDLNGAIQMEIRGNADFGWDSRDFALAEMRVS